MNRGFFASLRKINFKLFLALCVMALAPTIYTTVRVFCLGQLPGEWSYSIAGQLSWVNLLYEVLSEAIILPLYFFMGSVVEDRKEFANRIRTGLLVTFAVYTVCSFFVMVYIHPLLKMMAVSEEILAESAVYIRIECVANVFGILSSFLMVSLITIGKVGAVYWMTGMKLVLCIVSDVFLVSMLPVSLQLGVNGIGISNVIVNIVMLIFACVLIQRSGFGIFSGERMSFTWMKGLAEKGGISGMESFVRNFAYMMMVSRMVNVVGEQGTYWVANSFIWGWLLLPITQLAELIKKETAEDKNAVKENTKGYFFITAVTCFLWFVLLPLYKPFMRYVLGFEDVDKLFRLVLVLLGFYVLYAFQNVFDATFYGRGKTGYMLFESVVTNTVYYGAFFILYCLGVWTPTLIGIAVMFGCGNAFDSIVSYLAYRHFRRKLSEQINVDPCESF